MSVVGFEFLKIFVDAKQSSNESVKCVQSKSGRTAERHPGSKAYLCKIPMQWDLVVMFLQSEDVPLYKSQSRRPAVWVAVFELPKKVQFLRLGGA